MQRSLRFPWVHCSHRTLVFCAALGSSMVGACSIGPHYTPPGAPDVRAFKEASPALYQGADAGAWRPAQPQDAAVKGKWWQMFQDPELDALEDRLNIDNQNIARYFQNFMAARAQVRGARAGYFPVVTAAPAFTRSRSGAASGRTDAGTGGATTSNLASLPLDVSWAPDVWDRVRNTVRAFAYAAQVSAADLENERLTEQASLATYYFALRGQDALQDLYDRTVANDRQALQFAQAQAHTGLGNDEAVAQAEVTLENAQATGIGIAANRAVYEHAIATLIGTPASSFSMPVRSLAGHAPSIPVSVPSQLLQRRPDIAGAERAMAQANALIGVERAAYYPNLALAGGAGFSSPAIARLLTLPAFFWSLGASATQTIFDGGLRDATVSQYTASYMADVAVYRQTVLTAIAQVEDALATLRVLSQQRGRQEAAAQWAQKYLDIARRRYETGLDPYLDVLLAQTLLLGDEQTVITLRVSEMTAATQLIQALGGGWEATQLPGNDP